MLKKLWQENIKIFATGYFKRPMQVWQKKINLSRQKNNSILPVMFIHSCRIMIDNKKLVHLQG